ncbi:NEDD4-binding protein 2-like [Panonychus citri]|uniref:NEDD4-binding protein 2-like n=1 Tax=Panonychus citri TaxID=50023 RepID=UPI0023079FF9|nr:NEDD4-binding protein 2-like [Panonychus citri]
MMNGSPTISSSSSTSLSSTTTTPATNSLASSFGGKKGPKRLIGSLGLGANGGAFNWEIPPFPGESKVEPKVEEEFEVKLLCNRSTQVEDRDWALLEVEQNGFAFDLGADEIVYPSVSKPDHDGGWCNGVETTIDDDGIVFSKEYLRSRCDPKIDRGTYCEGFAGYLGYDEKVAKLSYDFPLAESTHIEEVLNACHGDYQWAFNLLSQFNEQHFTTSSTMGNQVNAANFDENILESSSTTSSPSPSAEEFNSCQLENDAFDIANQLGLGNLDQQSAQYSFYLDPAFAVELQSSFGQVLKEGEIDEKYLRVNCSKEVARLIHYLWINAYNSQSKDKPAQYVNPFSFLSFNKPSSAKVTNTVNTNKKESKANISKEAPIEPKSAFQEIMDLEMAISLSRKEFNSSQPNQANSKHAISTKLKREALKRSFPGLDEKALEELFEANAYRIKETIECIEDTLGIQITITPEVDALIKEETGYVNDHGEATFYINSQRSSSPSGSFNAGDVIRQLRGEITQCVDKKREFSEKGNTAFQAKMYAVASYYKGQAQEFDRKILQLRSQVIETVVRANPANTLDLHGVHTNEVLTTLGSYLSNKLDELNRRKLNRLRLLIITGRGAHSVAGPRLKPLVINYLKQKHYRYEIINPGVISVTLP